MRSGRATPLMLLAAMVLAAVYFHFDPLGNLRAPEPIEITDCDGAKAELLRLHNEKRAGNGVSALCVHPQLQAAAQGHAEDVLKRGFYEHVTPEGVDPGDRISGAGP